MDFPYAVLYEYAAWANDRVLSAAERLPAETWTRALGHSFGSLQHTMVHVLSSEELWLARWRGHSPRARTVAPEDCPDIPALRARWAGTQAAMREFIAGQGAEDWGRVVAYESLDGRPLRYPLWQLYLQVVNHGTHHRAEAATMLTDLGQAPEGLDFIFFAASLK